MRFRIIAVFVLSQAFFACTNESDDTPLEPRSFSMGFTSWSYGPTLEDVNNTYNFLQTHGDIYTEHIDNRIPWNAWINDLPLPAEFTNEIEGKANRRLNQPLLLSVSLLNLNRDDLAEDLDGSVPSYIALNDPSIENAYFKHVDYLVNQFSPDYLVIAIEVNELRLRSSDQWENYVDLINKVTARIKTLHPLLPISESVSLHNLFDQSIPEAGAYETDIFNHINQLDFIAISYYPFLKNQHSLSEYQNTFDFLHQTASKPIAMVETGQIAEDLVVPGLNISMEGTEIGQNEYLSTLLGAAQDNDYWFVVWWAHRDFDALWETFPAELKDIGQLWRDTGLVDESGRSRPSFDQWMRIYQN